MGILNLHTTCNEKHTAVLLHGSHMVYYVIIILCIRAKGDVFYFTWLKGNAIYPCA